MFQPILSSTFLALVAVTLSPAPVAGQETPPAPPTAGPRTDAKAGPAAGTDAKKAPQAPGEAGAAGKQTAGKDAAAGSAELRKKGFRLDASGLALQGFDPLSYFDAKGPKLGDKQFQHTERGVTYHFVSKQNRDAFAADPQKWEPPYGGWCAYAVIDGEKVEVDPTNFAIVDGKVCLFYKGFWGDARDKWQALIKAKNAAKVVAEADAGWKKLVAADQALVDAEAKAKRSPK